MFYAAIMVCSLQAGAVPPCMVLKDTKGPYETKELCEERVGEMVGMLPMMFQPPYDIKYKCTKNPDGNKVAT